MREIYNIHCFSDVLRVLFLPCNLQLSIRAICVYIFCNFSQQSVFPISNSKSFSLRTDLLDSLLETKPRRELVTPRKKRDFKVPRSGPTKAFFDGFSPVSDLKPKYQEKSFYLGLYPSGSFANSSFGEQDHAESHLGISENQSMISFNSRARNFEMSPSAPQFVDYKSKNTLVRFNSANSNEMPKHLVNKYFTHTKAKRAQLASMSSSSFAEDYLNLSGILTDNLATAPRSPKLVGIDWTANLSRFRCKMQRQLFLPEDLALQINTSTFQSVLRSLKFLDDGQKLPLETDIEVNNEQLGYVLMLLAMDNPQGSPGIFSMLLVQAFKNSSSEVRKSIFKSLCTVLRSNPNTQLDAVHKKLISDVLFVIFLEDKTLFLQENIAELLFDKGVHHLAFVVMGEQLANQVPGKATIKRRSKRVKTEISRHLELNVVRHKLEKVGINAEKYFRLCELLGLKQEKWGLYECLFESEKQAVRLLKLKENKHYSPFVEYIRQNPDSFKYQFESKK